MEIDLSKINEIDLECAAPDDDDDSFGNIVQAPTSTGEEPSEDDRPLNLKTGVIISFDDDDVDAKTITTKIVNLDEPVAPAISNPATGLSTGGINPIDMECSIGEDDDDDVVLGISAPSHSREVLDFGDDEPELIDEEVVAESRASAASQIDQGTVEDDYYDKLKKKHAKTNVKGAYNTHFHFAGDPAAEMAAFNHDMTPAGPVPNAVTVMADAAGQSMGESANPSYRKLFEELLDITGFELSTPETGKCRLKDTYSNDEVDFDTLTALSDFLTPYMQDYFVVPLQVETGNTYDNCKDWVNWYTPEMTTKYPQYKKDISYCDLFCNHLPECKLF